MKTIKIKNSKAKRFAAKALETILVTGYILFEELIWNVLAKPIYQYFKSLIAIEPLKNIFLEMNRYLLLSVFIVIFLVTEVMGLLAGYYFMGGYFFTGVLIYASKIPIAAFTFWLFDLTKPQLMTFDWLKKTYKWILGIIEKLLSSSIHQYIKARIIEIRLKVKKVIQKYFGEEGFLASIKSHYQVYKPYISGFLKR